MSSDIGAERGMRLQNTLVPASFRGFPWKTATILYTICWGWLLIAGDVNVLDEPLYWRTFPVVRNHGSAPWVDFVYINLFDFIHPHFWLYTFVSYFVISFITFHIVQTTSFLSFRDLRFFVFLVLILPFNTTRVSSMSLPNTTFLLLFFVSWGLLHYSTRIYVRILCLCFFFVSFATHSLLVFYLLPICWQLNRSRPLTARSVKVWLLKNIDFLLLPLLYVLLRKIFWTDGPNYQDLNQTKILSGLQFLVAICVIEFGLFLIWRRFRGRDLNGLRILGIGVFASGIGSVAYVVLGFYQPDLTFFRTFAITFLGRSAWLSRHQLLQPFGMALIIVGLIGLVSIKYLKTARFLRCGSIGISLLLCVCLGFEYLVDSKKQNEIIHELSSEETNSETNTFVFIDTVPFMNARGRPYKETTLTIFIHRSRFEGERDNLLDHFVPAKISFTCARFSNRKWVLIKGPRTHWQALKNWVSDGDMGFTVSVDDTPGACKLEKVTNQRSSGEIPILFYFTGARG